MHANHHHRYETNACTAATLRAARIRGRRVADILAACRFVAPARHAVCAAPPLFAQRYHLLFPMIIGFCCVGALSVANNPAHITTLLALPGLRRRRADIFPGD